VIRSKPDYVFAYYSRGFAYHAIGKYDLAIEDYTEAIRIQPDDAEAYFLRGNTYLNKWEYNLAILDYTKVIHINPDYAEAYYQRGNSYRDKRVCRKLKRLVKLKLCYRHEVVKFC